jgi:hypothetical protein
MTRGVDDARCASSTAASCGTETGRYAKGGSLCRGGFDRRVIFCVGDKAPRVYVGVGGLEDHCQTKARAGFGVIGREDMDAVYNKTRCFLYILLKQMRVTKLVL